MPSHHHRIAPPCRHYAQKRIRGGPAEPGASPTLAPCGKFCHATRVAAKRHIKELRAKGDDPRNTLGSYWCDRCTAWHVGHSAWREVAGA